MSNMGYCRFKNTLEDLKDCREHMDSDDLSDREKRYRRALVRVCKDIVDNWAEHGEFENE